MCKKCVSAKIKCFTHSSYFFHCWRRKILLFHLFLERNWKKIKITVWSFGHTGEWAKINKEKKEVFCQNSRNTFVEGNLYVSYLEVMAPKIRISKLCKYRWCKLLTITVIIVPLVADNDVCILHNHCNKGTYFTLYFHYEVFFYLKITAIW